MAIYSVARARNGLSQLIAEAHAGAEVLIANRGRPVVRLEPIPSATPLSGVAFATWLVETALPRRAGRPAAELDAQIVANRESWDL